MSKSENQVFDFEKICRLCLGEKRSMSAIFTKKKSDKKVPLPVRIMSCASLELFEGDGMPTSICNKCLVTVNASYAFREQCEQADTTLRRYAAQQQEKEGKVEELDEQPQEQEYEEEDDEEQEDMQQEEAEQGDSEDQTEPSPSTEDANTTHAINYLVDKEVGCSQVKTEPELIKEEVVELDASWDDQADQCDTPVFDSSVVMPDDGEVEMPKTSLHPKTKQNLPTQAGEKKRFPGAQLSGGGTTYLMDNIRKNKNLVIRPPKKILPSHVDKDFERFFRELQGKVVLRASRPVQKTQTAQPSMGPKGSTPQQFRRDLTGRTSTMPSVADVTRLTGMTRMTGVTPVTAKKVKATEANKSERVYCKQCRIFMLRSSYYAHVRYVHLKHKSFLCPTCGYAGATGTILRQHVQAVHIGYTFHCDKCPKKFNLEKRLRRHIEYEHEGKVLPRNHICQYCARAFPKSEALKRHIRCHTQETPYSCQFCDRKFKYRWPKVQHERLHTGEKPYQCTFCELRFTQNCVRKAHEYKAHGNEEYAPKPSGRSTIGRPTRVATIQNVGNVEKDHVLVSVPQFSR